MITMSSLNLSLCVITSMYLYNLSLLTFTATQTSAINDFPIFFNCTGSHGSPNSSYHFNLLSLLSSLPSKAANTITTTTGFYNITTSSDTIYGLFMCRRDIPPKDCQACVTIATENLTSNYCPSKREGLIWCDTCLVRFSDRNFYSSLDERPHAGFSNKEDFSGHKDHFNRALSSLLNDVVTLAAASSERFAVKDGRINPMDDDGKLYVLGQCLSGLSSDNCSTCLRDAVAGFPSCCEGKIGGRVPYPSCGVRYEIYPFYHLHVAAAPPAGKREHLLLTIVMVTVACVASVLCFLGSIFLRTRASRKNCKTNLRENFGEEITMELELLQFDMATIEASTNKFSNENVLGKGGFGSVFKGILPDGRQIAVKRLSQKSAQGIVEFKNEISVIARLQHRNLVRLLGYCLKGEEKILIYECVSNKSLNYFLFDAKKQRELTWPERYKIIRGIVRGILYLHEDSRLKIIHRDLKPSNVLLDGNMNPKISDFGMARMIAFDQTEENTCRIVGTYGYMSPEYILYGQFSVKSDVFSFGVMVLEIISGKRNASFYQSHLREDLLSYAWKQWKDQTPLELLDPTLKGEYSKTEVYRCIQIGLLCVQEDPKDRPTMATISLMLNSESIALPLPQEPAFFNCKTHSNISQKGLDPAQSYNCSVPFSINEVSLTKFSPR